MLVAVIIAVAVVLDAIVMYRLGRWAGWGFGLGWWGRPVPALVTAVEPLKGARMRGSAEYSMTVSKQRCRARLQVQPPGEPPYEADAIVWQEPTASLAGQTIDVRVSRTRPGRLFVPRRARAVEPADGRY